MNSHFFGLHCHFLLIWLLYHDAILHPLDCWQRKSLHLGWDVNGCTLLHNDGVALEELQNGDDWSN